MSNFVVAQKMQADGSSSSLTSPLFRQEVLAEQKTSWLGTVLIEPRVSHKLFARFAIAAAGAFIALLIFGSYTRVERISGWLVPEKGIVRVIVPQAGIVQDILVKEGQKVVKGEQLAVVSTDVQSEAVGATGAEVVRQLSSRRGNLLAQRSAQQSLAGQQISELESRSVALAGESELLGSEITLQRRRIQLTEGSLSRAQLLRNRGIITKASLGTVEGEHLDQSAKLQGLERSLSQLNREIATVNLALKDFPYQQNIKLGEIDREIATLEQAIAEAEAHRQIIVSAPQDGVVTAIQTEAGGNATPNVPLLSIVPGDSLMQAQLFAPSRAVGFIHEGNEVLLRYQPFPYQNFGFYQGKVANVSRTALNPAELPQQLSGLSSFYGTNAPVYRINVNLARQDVNAYGGKVPLQAGMQVDADVLIERHRLYEWMLYPLFAKTGAWAQ